MSSKSQANVLLAVAGGAAAWLVPGTGHVLIGRPVRGVILCLAVAATFWAGVAMGGVMTIDPVHERWWFVAQMCTGVHGLAAWKLQQHTWQDVLADEDVRRELAAVGDEPVLRTSVIDAELQRRGIALTTPTDTVARAYAGIAGLLNLMCIFDVMILSMMGAHGEPPPPARPAKGRGTGA